MRDDEESTRDDMEGGGDSPDASSSDGQENVVGAEARPAVRRAKAHRGHSAKALWGWVSSKTLLAPPVKKLARSKTVVFIASDWDVLELLQLLTVPCLTALELLQPRTYSTPTPKCSEHC